MIHHYALVIQSQDGCTFKVAPFKVQTTNDHLAVNDTFPYQGETYQITKIEGWGWNASDRELTVKLIASKMAKSKLKWSLIETSYVYHLIVGGLETDQITNILINSLLSYRTYDSIAKQTSEVRKYVWHSLGNPVNLETLPTGDALDVMKAAAGSICHHSLEKYKIAGAKIIAPRLRKCKPKAALTDEELFDKIDIKQIPPTEPGVETVTVPDPYDKDINGQDEFVEIPSPELDQIIDENLLRIINTAKLAGVKYVTLVVMEL